MTPNWLPLCSNEHAHGWHCVLLWFSSIHVTHILQDWLSKLPKRIRVHGPLTRYVKLRVAHEPGIPVTFSQPPRVSDPDMDHGTCVTSVPWCMPGSQTSGFLWSRWRGKRFRNSRRMRSPQSYVSDKRSMEIRSMKEDSRFKIQDSFIHKSSKNKYNIICRQWK